MRPALARIDPLAVGLAALVGLALLVIQEGPLVAAGAAISVLAVAVIAEPLAVRLRRENPQPVGDRYGPLSPRESEVAVLIAESLSNKEIAARLFIGERGVETQVQNIMAKLSKLTHTEFHSRTQIALWVKERQRQAKPVAAAKK